jgi:hypothetical protein
VCSYFVRGHRLIAESVLPLGPNSLILGSGDGSLTIHNDNLDMEARVQLCAAILNLKPHYVWDWYKREKVLVHLAVDCEGHRYL